MIRVYLVDDHTLVREGLKRLLIEAGDMTVAGESGGGERVVDEIFSAEWDVALLDMTMPAMSGHEVLKRLLARRPEARVVALSMHADEPFVQQMMKAGAYAYLSKGCPSDELLATIRRVHRGERTTPPAAPSAGGPLSTLADRELEVLQLLGRGKTPSEVAVELGLGPSTVSTYIHRIKVKLGLRSVGEIAQYAMKAGLVP